MKKPVLVVTSPEHLLLRKHQQFQAVQKLLLYRLTQHRLHPRALPDPCFIRPIPTQHRRPPLIDIQLSGPTPTLAQAGEASTSLLEVGRDEGEAVH